MPFGNDRSVKLTVAASMDGFANELAKSERAGQHFSKTIISSAADAAKGLAKVKDSAKEVAVPLLAIGTVAAAGVGYAIKSMSDFEAEMSSVKSLSHATTQEYQQLKTAALTTGTAIGYSATQAADAEIELVKAGVSASDIYGGALAGSLKLAAAGQIDVADATSIAASTLTQYGLKGRDVSHVADLLAAGADKALGGVSDLGEGLKYIGPVAATAHVGLEQTVGTLALLAQNGILGQQAGTGLRGMLLSLTSPSQLASDTMKQYGISVYNAKGEFVGFNGVAQELHDHLGKLGDAQRDAALGTIFGNAQVTTATILMNGGAKAVDKWTKSVNQQGFATEQAIGKMDNLNGDLTKFHAAIQTAAIETGEAADGPLRKLVQAGTDLIQTYSGAPSTMQAVVLGVGALTAVVALGSGTMLIAVPKIVAYGEALSTLEKANLPGVSKAAGGALSATKSFTSGLSSTATFLTGPYGLAIGAGAASLALFNSVADSGAVSQQNLTNAISTGVAAQKTLAEAGQRSSLSKLLVGDNEKTLKDIPGLLSQIGSSGLTAGTYLHNFEQSMESLVTNQKVDTIASLRQGVKSIQAYGSALAQVASADAPSAAKSFAELAKQQNLSRPETLKLLDVMGDYKAQLEQQASSLGITASKSNLLLLATGKYTDAAAKAKNPTQANSDALGVLQTSASDAAAAISATSDALKDLESPALDARSAQRDFQAAIDAASQSLKDNGAALNKQKTDFDISTEAGQKNQAALDAIAQTAADAAGALYTQTGSQEQATAAMQSGRDELIKALDQYGITGQAAQDYANQIIGTPTDWATTFTNNADAAGGSVDAYKGKVGSVPKLVTTLFKVQGDSSQVDTILAKIRIARSEMSDLNGKQVSGNGRPGLATGGRISGPGTGTSDDVPLWGSDGEWMIRESSASMYGPKIMHAINQGLLSKQQLAAAVSGTQLSKQQLVSAVGYANGGPIAQVRYATPAPQIIVQAPAGGKGDLNVTQHISAAGPSAAEIAHESRNDLEWMLRTA